MAIGTQQRKAPFSRRDRVKLALAQGQQPIPAHVLRSQGRRLLLGLGPRAAAMGEALQPGHAVRMLCRGDDAAYLRCGMIQSHPSARRLLVLLDEAPAERVQQRQYFRLPVGFPLLAGAAEGETPAPLTLDAESPKAPEGLRSHLRLLPLRNLSGGGCLCQDPEGHFLPGRQYRLQLCLPDGESPLAVSARVVRQTRLRGQGAAGLNFVGLPERDRERILRVLFTEYRRGRARGFEV
jgi:c-di-GMP-binding flagellar brake protein YcgR